MKKLSGNLVVCLVVATVCIIAMDGFMFESNDYIMAIGMRSEDIPFVLGIYIFAVLVALAVTKIVKGKYKKVGAK